MRKIFQYRTASACDSELGDDDGFSVGIYRNGTIIYKGYGFHDQILFTKKYYISQRFIKKMENYIAKCGYEEIPHSLDNNSCDGSFDVFYFYSHDREYCIESLNIECSNCFLHGDIPDNENDMNEMKLLIIFNDVCKLLNRGGYRLSLYNFRKKFLRIF